MENKYKTIIILILACFILAIGYIAGHKNSQVLVAPYTDTVSVIHVKLDTLVLTDTVKSLKYKHINAVAALDPRAAIGEKPSSEIQGALPLSNIMGLT